MAIRYWKATTSGSAIATATNWTGSGVLTNDDLIIDLSNSTAAIAAGVTTGVTNTIVSATLTCNSLTVIDTVSKPLTITGTSTFTIGGNFSGNQFIITANTVWNHTGTITCQTSSTFNLNTGGGVIQAPITLGTLSNQIGIYKTTGLFKTSKTLTLTYGTLDISNYDLYCGIFSSSSNTVRSIAFGTSSKGIYLDNTATATIFTMTVSGNFSYTGPSRIVVTNSGNLTTKTINTTGLITRSVAMNFYFSDANKTNSNTIAVTSNSYFLDFDATNWNTAGNFSNGTRTILGNLNLCEGTTWITTTSTLITTFDPLGYISGNTQTINYANATGVGPITIYTYTGITVNITSNLNLHSNAGIVFTGSSSGIINLNAYLTAVGVTQNSATLNINNTTISATTYTLNGGTLNIISPSLGVVSCSSGFTMTGGTLKFNDAAVLSLMCYTFTYSGGIIVGAGTSVITPGTSSTGQLPQQINVQGRTGTYAVSVTNTPIITGNIGFLLDYSGTSTVIVLDNSGAFNYTFNTAPLTITSCVFKDLDLSLHSSKIGLPVGSSFTVNGSFYDNANLYKTTTTASTNTTATIYLNGGTVSNPKKLNFNSTSALNLVVNGNYQSETEHSSNGSVSSIVVNNGGTLNFANSNIITGTFTLNSGATFKHNDGTYITLNGVGSSTGIAVFDGSSGTILSTNNRSGNIQLTTPGTVTTNIRILNFPISKASQCIGVTFDSVNPKDTVKMYGTCGQLDAFYFQGTLDITNLKCGGYYTVQAPYAIVNNTLSVFTDETAQLNDSLGGVSLNGCAYFSVFNAYMYGSGKVYLYYDTTAGYNLYLRDSVTVNAPGVNFQTLDIGDNSSFTTGYPAPTIVIGAAGTYKCSKTATLTEPTSVTFSDGGYFYTGGKTYDTLETRYGSGTSVVQMYDDNATIDTYIARNSLIINGNNTTITNINADAAYTGDINIILRNTTSATTFSFSTINYLSPYKFYLNTDSSTAYPVTVKFDKPLLVGTNSSPYPSNSNIRKVSNNYTVTNFANLGTYESGTSSYDPAKILYVYTGLSGGSSNFFLMF